MATQHFIEFATTKYKFLQRKNTEMHTYRLTHTRDKAQEPSGCEKISLQLHRLQHYIKFDWITHILSRGMKRQFIFHFCSKVTMATRFVSKFKYVDVTWLKLLRLYPCKQRSEEGSSSSSFFYRLDLCRQQGL